MKNNISFQQIKPLLQLHYTCNQVPLLVGAPGIGKSSLLKELADHFKTQVFTLSVNHLGSREDLTGVRSVKDEKSNTYRQVFFPHAVIQDAIDYAKEHPDENPILFLDEINRTDSDVTSAIMALITERRVGTTEFPENLRLVAAGNDNGNVNTLDKASISRTAVYHMTPDISEFIRVNPDLNKYIRDILVKNPKYLVSMNENASIDDEDEDEDGDDLTIDQLFDTDSMSQITVPRTITYLSQVLNQSGFNGVTLPDDLDTYLDVLNMEESPIQKLIIATIGESDLAFDVLNAIQESVSSLTKASTASAQKMSALPKPNDQLVDDILSVQSKDQIDDILKSNKYSDDEIVDSIFTILSTESYKTAAYPQLINDFYDVITLTKFDSTQLGKINKTFATAIQSGIIAQPVLKHIQNDVSALSETFKILIDSLV